MTDHRTDRPFALLVGVQLPGVSDAEHEASLAELGRLVDTLGYSTLATLSQRRGRPRTGTVLGAGKLMEIAKFTGGPGAVQGFVKPGKQRKILEEDLDEPLVPPGALLGLAEGDEEDPGDDDQAEDQGWVKGAAGLGKRKAEVVAFDCDLTPTELRNLETAFDCEVLDRTGIIVEIFHRHARTREARAQVEIARLRYMAPRMRMMRKQSERQGGGIGGRGAGESALELDRRRIRDRIAELTRELESVKSGHEQRRSRRKDQARVALVGYTNAGKSSLMRALTGSEVLVQDKLFATLDTTVRALHPETVPRILITDTVGFIKKLPHDLVASFRSTLDEAHEASLLFFVVDASDPTFRSQLAVTKEVLGDIGALDIPSQLILNKIDRVDEFTRHALRAEFPDAVQMSTLEAKDVRALHEHILGFFETGMVTAELRLPYSHNHLIGEVRRSMRVCDERYDEDGVVLSVKAFPEDLQKIETRIAQPK